MNTRKMNENYVIELRNISRQFGTQKVLRDVSFGVRQGETLVVIGESGCGKSVMMKLIMNLLQPSEGDVLWNRRSISDRSARELHRDRLRIGYLFQGAALFDSLSVYENIAFGLKQNTKIKKAEVDQIVVERLREVGLAESISKKKPAELSGGMKKGLD